MENEYILVTKGPERAWTVVREPHRRSMMSFEVKSHAIAFARAVSFSRKLTLLSMMHMAFQFVNHPLV